MAVHHTNLGEQLQLALYEFLEQDSELTVIRDIHFCSWDDLILSISFPHSVNTFSDVEHWAVVIRKKLEAKFQRTFYFYIKVSPDGAKKLFLSDHRKFYYKIPSLLFQLQ
jgi:hypothetical protein